MHGKSLREFTVTMSGCGVSDRAMERWCTWFESKVDALFPMTPPDDRVGENGEYIVGREVNFADNQLTEEGVGCLLQTFLARNVAVRVLKFHHNQLETGTAVANYLRKCRTLSYLKEVHISHNKLSTEAARDVIVAAASAKEADGSWSFPRRNVPLWLRVEQNCVDPKFLIALIDVAAKELQRSGRIMCSAMDPMCSPTGCARWKREPPPIHAKSLAQQRRRKVLVEPYEPGETTPEQRQKLEAWEMRPIGHRAPSTAAEHQDKGSQSSTASTSTTTEQSFTSAEILRWDAEQDRWVADIIDVPNNPFFGEEEEQANSTMSKEELMASRLRRMIGMTLLPPHLMEKKSALLAEANARAQLAADADGERSRSSNSSVDGSVLLRAAAIAEAQAAMAAAAAAAAKNSGCGGASPLSAKNRQLEQQHQQQHPPPIGTRRQQQLQPQPRRQLQQEQGQHQRSSYHHHHHHHHHHHQQQQDCCWEEDNTPPNYPSFAPSPTSGEQIMRLLAAKSGRACTRAAKAADCGAPSRAPQTVLWQ